MIMYARCREIRISIRAAFAQPQVADFENGRHFMLSAVHIADQDYEHSAKVSISSGPQAGVIGQKDRGSILPFWGSRS